MLHKGFPGNPAMMAGLGCYAFEGMSLICLVFHDAYELTANVYSSCIRIEGTLGGKP